jgi:hypothetical protein
LNGFFALTKTYEISISKNKEYKMTSVWNKNTQNKDDSSVDSSTIDWPELLCTAKDDSSARDDTETCNSEWEVIKNSKTEKVVKGICNTFNINYQETISQVFKNWPSQFTMTYITLKSIWMEDKYKFGNNFTLTAGIHQNNFHDQLHFSVLVYTSQNNSFYMHFYGHLHNTMFFVRAVSAQTNRGHEGMYRECIALYPEKGEICATGIRK